jgi:hypothetical protein
VIEWRTVQLFLGEDGVCEVELDLSDNRNVRCSCARSSLFGKCKHIKFIENAIESSGGQYSIQVPNHVDELEAALAFDDAESFREFVVKYAKVEVL